MHTYVYTRASSFYFTYFLHFCYTLELNSSALVGKLQEIALFINGSESQLPNSSRVTIGLLLPQTPLAVLQDVNDGVDDIGDRGGLSSF